MTYITDEQFIKAQDAYNNEPDETKANEIITTIFWPYLKNLSYCTVRKILRQRGVDDYYSTEEIDEIANDVVCALVNRYVESKKGEGRCWNKHHTPYRKDHPKAMVYLCAQSKISEYGKGREEAWTYLEEATYDTFEDDIIEKLTREGY